MTQLDIMLIDFGISKYIGEDVSGRPLDDFTRITEFVGPQNFSSPELLAYARDKDTKVDQRSDLFQLGLILWFLNSGKIPAGIPPKREDQTGGKLWDLVCQLIQMDPDDRPNSASLVKAELDDIGDGII